MEHRGEVWDHGRPVARDWLLITVSTPPGGTSTLRVYAWRNLRGLGGHYLQQSVCLLPATAKTTRAAARLVTRLRAEGGHGEMLRIRLTDSKQEAAVIDAIQRERTDEYREVVESTRQFHEELSARAPPRPDHVHRARGVRRRPRPLSEVARLDPCARLLRCARRSGGRRGRRLMRGGTRPVRERSAVRGARRVPAPQPRTARRRGRQRLTPQRSPRFRMVPESVRLPRRQHAVRRAARARSDCPRGR